jgi:Flp pilus assembly protein TadD
VAYDLFQKLPERAQARVSEQIAKVPNISSLYVMLARLQIDNRQFDKADATLQKAMQLDASDGNAVSLYAQVQVMRGDINKAITVWEQWSQANPANANSWAVLGTLEESRGNLDKAATYYKKALQLQPDQPVAANNLAYLMIERGENIDVALSLAQTARRRLPDAPNAADTLAWAYYHKGTYASARDLLEQAVKSAPGNAAMQYHLGMTYFKLSDKKNALIHLKKAQSLAPNTPVAAQAEKALQNLS